MSHNTCPKCKELGTYSEKYDAFLCTSCNDWLEDLCDDPFCTYCKSRPEKPKSAYLGKVKAYTDVHALYSLEHFRSLITSGGIMPGDGRTGCVFVDGIHLPEIYLADWNDGPNDPIAKNFAKGITTESIDKSYPGKTIHVEWLHD